jgi:hypothetical protein
VRTPIYVAALAFVHHGITERRSRHRRLEVLAIETLIALKLICPVDIGLGCARSLAEFGSLRRLSGSRDQV